LPSAVWFSQDRSIPQAWQKQRRAVPNGERHLYSFVSSMAQSSVSAPAEAKNVSHEMEIWKQLIETELKWEAQSKSQRAIPTT
jgi:hypothetical protein